VSAPTIRRFLDLSTSHLPQKFFLPDGPDLTAAYPTGHGLLLWVPDDPESYVDPEADDDDGDAMIEIITIRRYARAHGCDYILLDADGPECADLPTWRW
jgi:hypothetical protein